MSPPANVLAIIGPTASGKSDLALAVAESAKGTIINADSMQLYRDLEVLTARPGTAELARVPHRLYGILPAEARSSAQLWREWAEVEIRAALSEGRLPILCGGTGFYLKAILEGLSPIPDIPAVIRAETRADVARDGPVAAWEKLNVLDRASAARIEPTDSQRISRALEVHRATGRVLSDWHKEPLPGPPAGLTFTVMALNPPRPVLNERCDTRFGIMLEQGALTEVQRLIDSDPPADASILKAVGAPELLAYLRGEMSLEEAAIAARTATRRYAKRQQTWLKSQIVSDIYINAQFSEKIMPEVLSFIRERGLINE